MPEKCALSHGSGVLGRDPRDSCRFRSPHVRKVCTITQFRLGEGGGGGDTIGGGGGRRTENRDHIYIYTHTHTKFAPRVSSQVRVSPAVPVPPFSIPPHDY